jgi:hypothetical protein
MSVGPSIFTHGTSQLTLDGFHEIRYLSILLKSIQKIQVSKKSDKNKEYFKYFTGCVLLLGVYCYWVCIAVTGCVLLFFCVI